MSDVEAVYLAHNKIRAELRRQPLFIDKKLTKAAESHAAWMLKNKKMSHYEGWFWSRGISTRIAEQGYTYSYIGENVAAGQTTPEQVMHAWTHSRAHYLNMTAANFKHIGIARAGNYWCVCFGRP